jgi:hypothetical protein
MCIGALLVKNSLNSNIDNLDTLDSNRGEESILTLVYQLLLQFDPFRVWIENVGLCFDSVISRNRLDLTSLYTAHWPDRSQSGVYYLK